MGRAWGGVGVQRCSWGHGAQGRSPAKARGEGGGRPGRGGGARGAGGGVGRQKDVKL